jgi:hypothetical protein
MSLPVRLLSFTEQSGIECVARHYGCTWVFARALQKPNKGKPSLRAGIAPARTGATREPVPRRVSGAPRAAMSARRNLRQSRRNTIEANQPVASAIMTVTMP